MKVGIVTYHTSSNYGAVLQAFALQTKLKMMGHEPFFIDYQYRWDVSCPKGIRAWISRKPSETAEKINNQLLKKQFVNFLGQYLNIAPYKYHGSHELQSSPPMADAYICGSDQVWNPNFIWEMDDSAVWLDFGEDSIRRIAYAASFGIIHLTESVRARWKHFPRRFDAVSVRESDGLDLLGCLGRHDAVWVPDPTLLLAETDYGQLAPISADDKAMSVFCYQLGTDNHDLFLKTKSKVSSVLGLCSWESRPQSFVHNLRSGYASPTEWLSRLRRSKFVVTNSFHGLAFSLIFRRPFIVILRANSASEMNSRVITLLDLLGLRNRAIANYDDGKILSLLSEEIDWAFVESKLEGFRETGCSFLAEALK